LQLSAGIFQLIFQLSKQQKHPNNEGVFCTDITYNTNMKKILIYSVFIYLLFFSVPTFIHADTIESFEVEIKINKDNTADVSEKIIYTFSEEGKHGIYREIPKGFRAEGNILPVGVSIQSVTDENGMPYQFSNEAIGGVNLKIGNPDVYVSGFKTYVIKYRVKNAIGFFEKNDEFYWNLTGNEWQVDFIRNTTATITFPENVEERIVNHAYCGGFGSSQVCGSFSVSDKTVNFFLGERALTNGEGVTVDLEFDKEIIKEPTAFDNVLALFARYYFIPLAFILAIVLFRSFFKVHIRSAKAYRKFTQNNPEVVQYDPAEFSLIEASFFHDGKTSIDTDLSGIVVWAAIHKYIRIIEEDKTYLFEKFENFGELAESPERELIERFTQLKITKNFGKNIISEKDKKISKLFARSDIGIAVELNELVDSVFNVYAERVIRNEYIDITKTQKLATKILTSMNNDNFIKKNYFNAISFNKWGMAFIFLFLTFNPGLFFIILNEVLYGIGYIPSITFALMGVMTLVFLKSIPTYTEKGFRAANYINGLYRYVDMAEKDRINFANGPEKTPVLFEKLLPYAIVFGLEKKWTKEFKNIYGGNEPIWFASTTGGFVGFSISDISNSIKSSTHIPSSGGSSGGGGFSGGGGGGGGGGSW